MSKKKGGIVEFFYGRIAPIITGVGAAVVIVGALFKIQHWNGGGDIITVGLLTEAFIFAMFAFQPQHKEPDWALVYPELDSSNNAPSKPRNSGASATQQLDNALQNAKIGPELINSLGSGIQNLSLSVGKMATLGDAFGATKAYTENVQKASASLADLNKVYSVTVGSVGQVAEASKNVLGQLSSASKATTDSLNATTQDAKLYHQQIQQISKRLEALNAVYDIELKESNNHIKAAGNFYSTYSNVIENISAAANDSKEFRNQVNKLSHNLGELNKVYGNMVNAIRA